MRLLVAVLCLALCGLCGILAWLASVSVQRPVAVQPRPEEAEPRELSRALRDVAGELDGLARAVGELAEPHEAAEAGDPPEPGLRPPRARVRRAPPRRTAQPDPGPHLVETFEDGTKSCEGYQIQDANGDWILHGDWLAWHENGELYEEGSYFQGKEEGAWTWWHDNGARMASGAFRDGNREGLWTFWYPNGVKQMEGQYVHGKAQGVWTSWHENGRTWVVGEQRDGEAQGRWQVTLADGTVDGERSGVYEAGARIGD